MRFEAAEAGIYESELWGGPFDRVQIFSIEDLLKGARPNIPKYLPGYTRAKKVEVENPDRIGLFDSPTSG